MLNSKISLHQMTSYNWCVVMLHLSYSPVEPAITLFQVNRLAVGAELNLNDETIFSVSAQEGINAK